jgi:hypothetical protein
MDRYNAAHHSNHCACPQIDTNRWCHPALKHSLDSCTYNYGQDYAGLIKFTELAAVHDIAYDYLKLIAGQALI